MRLIAAATDQLSCGCINAKSQLSASGVVRFLYCFDLDDNGDISFSEFVLLFSMFSPSLEREEKYK